MEIPSDNCNQDSRDSDLKMADQAYLDSASSSPCSKRVKMSRVDDHAANNQQPLQGGTGDECNGRFFFESDHLALKNNPDYQLMLKTLATLEAQRKKVLQDVDTLIRRKRQALRNPVAFIESLTTATSDPLPLRQDVATVPGINLDRYTQHLKLDSSLLHHKYGTRQKAENRHYQTLEDTASGAESKNLVRGKLLDESKAKTFNQLWTPNEQTRLEQLLDVYPPEEIESRRWEKIASALGNRTVKQVQSRVQKYFIKLAKAGLPVPGRKPSATLLTNKSKFKRREKPVSSKLSTFFSSFEPKVYMEDGEEESSYSDEDDDEETDLDSRTRSFLDEDYIDFRSSQDAVGYNYLDPNFCPAT